MATLIMLCGGIGPPDVGRPAAVSAHFAYNPQPGKSCLFKVQGPADAASVIELPSATSLEHANLRQQLGEDLWPVLDEIATRGGAAATAEPRFAWVIDPVRDHLRRTEGAEP